MDEIDLLYEFDGGFGDEGWGDDGWGDDDSEEGDDLGSDGDWP